MHSQPGGRAPRHELERLIVADYPAVAGALFSGLAACLRSARDLFGDLDMANIMLVVAIRTSEHPDFASAVAALEAEDEAAVLPSLGVNARSIGDSMGIPRETARRKVLMLLEAGLIARVGADLRMTAAGYRASKPLWDGIATLASQYHQVVDRLHHGELGRAPRERRDASNARR